MNRRTLQVLLAIAVAAVLLAVVGQRNQQGPARSSGLVGMELVPGLGTALGEIDRIAVTAPGGTEAATLTRTDGAWTVEQMDGYPADFSRVREALVAIAEARVIEEKTANPDFYDRLGVDPIDLDDAGGIGVTLSGPDRSFPQVILGSSESGDTRFARLADQAVSVLIDRDPDFASEAGQWLLPDLLDVRGDRVQRVEITHADGERLVISKSESDETNFSVQDIPAGRELQYASVANVTGNALRELRLQSARVASDRGSLLATAEYFTFDGLVVTVTGTSIDGETWVAITARFDEAQALDFATEPVDGGVAAAGGPDAAGATGSDATPQAEADDIRSRLAGWQFTIPSHIYDQMTRRIEDLLREPAEDEEG